MNAVGSGALSDVAASSRIRRRDCAAAARRLYQRGPLLRRLMQHGRPYICPFERLVDAVPAGSTVLDAGCGDGLLLALLATFGRLRTGVGFDANAAAIAHARQMQSRLPALVTFERREAGADWPDGRFDVVTLIDLLHHVSRDAQTGVLRAAAQRVGPGGLLIYKDMADRPRWRALVSRIHDLCVAGESIHLVPFATARDVLEGAGLALERHETMATGPYLHELGVFRRPYDTSKLYDDEPRQ